MATPYIFDDRINEVRMGDKAFFHAPESREWFYGTVMELDEGHNMARLVDDETGTEMTVSGRYIRLYPSDANGYEIEIREVVFDDDGNAYEVIGYAVSDGAPGVWAWGLAEDAGDDMALMPARSLVQHV